MLSSPHQGAAPPCIFAYPNAKRAEKPTSTSRSSKASGVKTAPPAVGPIANLGSLSDQEIDNLKVALQASRQDIALVMPGDPAQQEWPARIIATLSYLDVAVALETWNRWKLPRLFNRLLPQNNEAVPPGNHHRCPGPAPLHRSGIEALCPTLVSDHRPARAFGPGGQPVRQHPHPPNTGCSRSCWRYPAS